MLISFYLSINVLRRHSDKSHRWGWKERCLLEMRNIVYVAKVTKLSHKKCTTWYSLISISQMQPLSRLCCKFHFLVMTSQIPPFTCMSLLFLLLELIKPEKLGSGSLSLSLSLSLSMVNTPFLSRTPYDIVIAHWICGLPSEPLL